MIVETTFLGLALTTAFVEFTGLYPGGIIVPSYLALYLRDPGRICGTVVVAILSWLSYQLLSHLFILYGRRRFVLIIFLGGLWSILWREFFPIYWSSHMNLMVIGWIVPGLIANTIERQGLWITLLSMGIVTVATYFLRLLLLGY